MEFRKPVFLMVVACAIIFLMRGSFLSTAFENSPDEQLATSPTINESSVNQEAKAGSMQTDSEPGEQVSASPTSVAKKSPNVFAHYMPWFRTQKGNWEHWRWSGEGQHHNPANLIADDRRDIAAVHYPLIGAYDSLESRVIEYHILTARLAGIDGFICNWYGPGSTTDNACKAMLPIARKYGFQLAICMEEKAFYPPYSKVADRESLKNEMQRQLEYVLDTYCADEVCPRADDRPLVFLFNNWGKGPVGEGQLTPEEIGDVTSRFKANAFQLVRSDEREKFWDVCGGMFAWPRIKGKEQEYLASFHRSAVAGKSTGLIDYAAGVACPGFDDSGVNGWGNGIRKIERRGVDEYTERWNQFLSEPLDAIQIATWNDFQEGTTIEPTREYGFQFVDLTEQMVGRLTKKPVNVKDNRLGLSVYRLRTAIDSISSAEQKTLLHGKVDEQAKGLFRDPPTASAESLEALAVEVKAANAG